MSCLEKEDLLLLQSKHASQKQPKRSYTREFLLSLCGLDICKNLPRGFDAAALGELEDVLICTNTRQRGSGDLTFHSLKHGDYGSSPPNSYSRGSSGRWDTRSSRSTSRDGDPSDREAFMQDSGKHFGTQYRRFWQQSEHDGLLGSGAFARPSGYAGPPATKAKGPDHIQLNRGSEPYQPPRPYKALPFQRKDNNDSRNDETFGSSEYSSEDRVEEERKRRASFELMRKEQQKSLQEQNKNSVNQKIKHEPDIIALLEKTVDTKNLSNKNEKTVDTPMVSHNDASRPSVTQASAYRPLIPPGFASSALDKKIPCHSSSTSFPSEDGFADTANKLPRDATDNDQENKSLSAACVNTSIHTSGSNCDHNSEKCSLPSDSQIGSHAIGSHNITSRPSEFQRGHPDLEKGRDDDASDKVEKQSDILNSFSQDTSASVLEKLFGTALSKVWEAEPMIPENQGSTTEEKTLNPTLAESSKFASWFLEEEKESTEVFSSSNLLALIVNNEKVDSSSSVVHDKPIEHVTPPLPFEIGDTTFKLNASPAILANNFPEQSHRGDKVETPSNVLSCEQLEQAFLSEAQDRSSTQQYSVQDTWIVSDGNSEQQKPAVDDNASRHLLSLLQKGTNKEKDMIFPMGSSNSSLKVGFSEDGNFCGSATGSSSDMTLTLGTLFGAAFMSELKSAEAPVSIQRAPEGRNTDSTNPLSLGEFENANFVSYNSESYLPDKHMHEAILATSSHKPEANVHHVPVPKMVLGNPLFDKLKLNAAGLEEGALEIHLPEESLIPGRTSSQLPDINNASRPLFPELDHLTNRNKFVGQDGILHEHYQNTRSNVPHHNALGHAGGPWFDPSMHHLMLQQMPIPPNFPPQFPLQGFPRGVPSSHPINHMHGYTPEMNNVHNVALPHHQPNYGSLGKGVPGPMGGSHPDDLQRFADMEIRANSKYVHPVPAAHIPGIYGSDFDMNLRFR